VEPRVVLASLSEWEIECCVPPPALGDVVSWPLMMFVDRGADRRGPSDPTLDRRWWRVERWDDESTVLVDGDVHAFWAVHGVEPPAPGVAEVEGALIATLHWPPVPEGLLATRGRISRLWVTRHRYQRHGIGKGAYRAVVPGSTNLREVERGPDWSRRDDRSDPDEHDDGLLVELTVLPPGT
jgi:hypothetical protein